MSDQRQNSDPSTASTEMDLELQALLKGLGEGLVDEAPKTERGADTGTSDTFTKELSTQVDRAYRFSIMKRLGIGLALFILLIPIQDLAIAIAPLFVTQIFDIPNQWVAVFLTPLNSVGSLVSIILFAVRLTQKRLLNHLAVS